jgi:hypothetical protein
LIGVYELGAWRIMPDEWPKIQTQITRYFHTSRPKRGTPISLLHDSAIHGRNLQFAAILDLPNEILLLILDHLRLRKFEQLDCPVLPFRGHESERKYTTLLDLDPVRRLYAVCKRFHNLFGNLTFESISCTGTTSLHRLNTMLERLPSKQVK